MDVNVNHCTIYAYLYDEQLKTMMMEKSGFEGNVLTSAASKGNEGCFERALAAAKDVLSPSEVRHPLCLTK